MDSVKNTKCRLCGVGELSYPIIDLGHTPLANEFLTSKEKQDTFALQVCECLSCGHFQLNEIVSPERLFRHYLFVSGTSPVNIKHFHKYADSIVQRFCLDSKSKVLDIASNDGVFLQRFKELGVSILGIDPAKNIAEEATKNGIPTIAEFFTKEYAEVIKNNHGQFDVVSANNVFAHVPDMIGFADGVKTLLKPNGVFVFEVSYFGDVCDHVVFDTIYHEHMSYHTIRPLVSFFENKDMKIIDVERIPNHGGSIRVFVSLKDSCHNVSKNVQHIIDEESSFTTRAVKLQEKINDLGNRLNELLHDIHAMGDVVAVYGVPAKATTLMYGLNIDEKMISFAVDDAPLKQGTFTPGKHIPVLETKAIYDKRPKYILILAWNFSESIIEKHKGFGGNFIVPLPNLRII